jgi:glycosyltransferase involved in cell wall biosynthesis
MRVLILADSCNPDWMSLPAVAYKACRAIAEHADVVVATHVRNEPALSRTQCGAARIEYIDTESVAAPLYRFSTLLRGGDKLGWTTNAAMSYPSYVYFEHKVWKRFRSELEAGAFDVVHRLTPMSPTIPSPLARWSPVPFVIGPLNGGLPWPEAYRGELRREREYLSALRDSFRWLPYHHSTYSRAAAILAAFQHTIDDLPAGVRDKVINFPEVGVDTSIFHPPEHDTRQHDADQLTFFFAGRLVPCKCVDVLLLAIAKSATLRKHRFVIAGEGPERPMLTKLIEEHDLASCAELIGWKNQSQVAELMRSSDVFAFPSIRELGAGVVIEAMACGCVPVVVDYGGPGGLVDEGCGVRVPLGSKPELVDAFAHALESLANDRQRLRRASRAAARRARASYSWEAKARKTIEAYEWALGTRHSPPVFGDEVATELSGSAAG